MKTMNNITVDLPTARNLADAGWEQDRSTHFGWYKIDDEFKCGDMWGNWLKHGEAYAAPTAEEVLRELPSQTNERGSAMFPRVSAVEQWEDGEYDTLANAASQMWIYLKTNDLLK